MIAELPGREARIVAKSIGFGMNQSWVKIMLLLLISNAPIYEWK